MYMLHDLRIKKSKRIVAMLAFMARLMYLISPSHTLVLTICRLLPVIITRLVYVIPAYRTHDRPFDDYHLAIATSVHINFSVLASCTPFLKPIMSNLQSGILAIDMRSQHRTSTRSPGQTRTRPVSTRRVDRDSIEELCENEHRHSSWRI